jgi:hypothetical protein
MIYFEHCLRRARVPPPRLVHVVGTSGEPWVFRDLRGEMLDLFPQASVREGAPGEPSPAEADLVIVPLVETPEFPYQDVAYRSLPLLKSLAAGPLGRSRAHVMVYRARWREAEVVAAASLGRYASRLALELRALRAMKRATERSAGLKGYLKPRF